MVRNASVRIGLLQSFLLSSKYDCTPDFQQQLLERDSMKISRTVQSHTDEPVFRVITPCRLPERAPIVVGGRKSGCEKSLTIRSKKKEKQ